MLLFAHTGITLGTAMIADHILCRSLSNRISVAVSEHSHSSNPAGNSVSSSPAQYDSNISSSATVVTSVSTTEMCHFAIDYRFIIIGSMLPDLIDKPLGQVLLRDTFSNGRIFSHTFLFLALFFIIGIITYRTRKNARTLNLSFGVLCHVMLDAMWLIPCTFLWPLCGFEFEKHDLSRWLELMLSQLLKDPGIYVPELLGFIITVYFCVLLIAKKSIRIFTKSGRI